MLLKQLAKDIGHENWKFVVNTVGNNGKRSNEKINAVLADIANTNPRGALHDTQKGPQRINQSVHGYNHTLVGENNARLFIKTFVNGEAVTEK